MIVKWHRWLAAISSVFFLFWLLSGILMISPRVPVSNSGPRSKIMPDYSTTTLSPSQALRKLETIIEEIPQVRNVQLHKILDVIAYQMVLKNGQSYLINAQTGEEITIDASLSIQIAESYGPGNSQVKSTEFLTNHSSEYPWGPLPVYKVAFNDTGKTIAFVSIANGAITQSHLFQRIRATLESFHDFGPLRHLGTSDRVKKILLVLVSLVGVCAVGTGIFIFVKQLPR